MAIVKLKKLTFCGLLSEKKGVLAQLQAMGELHLIRLSTSRRSREREVGHETECVIQALRYLNTCPNKRHQVKKAKSFNLDQTVDQVLKLRDKSRELRDRYDAINKRIKQLEPWGNFQLPKTGLLAVHRFWFYIIPKRMMNRLKDCKFVWQTVYQDNLNCYVVVISETEPPEDALPVARTHTGSIPLAELENQASELELALEDLQAQRESLTRWITLITSRFNESLDHDALIQAETLTHDDAGVFVLQAWLPEKHIDRYHQFAEEKGLAVFIEDPGPDDKPPTLLENPPSLAGGEDLVNFYQTPAYGGWDPSMVVFVSFSLFFALIMSDAGYAGVFAGLLASKWRSLGRDVKGRRIRMLSACTISLSVIWGILCGSYFGYEPKHDSLLSTFQIFSLNDFDGMMRFTIGVGVFHIALANLIKAWQLRTSSQALAPLGWIAMVTGGFCYWLATDQDLDSLRFVGQIGLVFGVCLLILFSSERHIKRWTDWLWRLSDGIRSLVSITQLFGDVLSYMRLFALGLASASLALTFNKLAEEVMQTWQGAGLLFGILILLLGHTLNLLLCVLSGCVHGLRLNFIEFYNWSVSDEGYPFKAFSKKGVRQ